MSKLTNLGMICALIGIGIVVVFSKTAPVLYTSSAFLLIGALLGLAYALGPRIKPTLQQISGLSALEFGASVLVSLEYYAYNISLMPSALFLSLAFMIPTICGFYVVTYREKR